MRIVIALLVVAALSPSAAAQLPESYVELDLPAEDILVLIHPTLPARLSWQGDGLDSTVDVQVGHSSTDPWGMCFFNAAMSDAQAIIIQPHPNIPVNFVLLDTPLTLDAAPAANGWTTVDFDQLRGGGFSEEPASFVGFVEDHTGCTWSTEVHFIVRSSDINGDLVVNLSDIAVFAQALQSQALHADFNGDDVVNLSDITLMAQGIHDQ